MDLARFERATSTFAESRSISAELQVLRLPICDCGLAEAAGLEPARALHDGLANRCHTIRRRLPTEFRICDCGLRIADCGEIRPSRILNSAIRNRLSPNPQSIGGRLGSRTLHGLSRRSFQDCLTHSTVGPSVKNWQGRSLDFGFRISDCGFANPHSAF